MPNTIDEFIVANEPEFSDAVKEIARSKYVEAFDRSPISTGNFVQVE